MSTTFDTGRDDADLAAEYVLGVLDGAERREVERRAARDEVFAAEIAAWTERLTPMVAAVPEIAPPVELWARIAADLDRVTRRAETRMAGGQAFGEEATGGRMAGARPQVRPRRRGRSVSALWQWLGLGGMGLAVASLAALLFLGPLDLANRGAAPAAGTLTATLASDTGQPLLTVVVDRGEGTATLVPVSANQAQGRVPELWLIPEGGAPQSLGLIDEARPLRLYLSGRDLSAAGTALAVSLEPAGGSPTGAPTGPVVASGPLQPL